MAADWQAIKTEYITTGTSYRKLSEKYGISANQVCNVGKKEGWVQLRRQYLDKTVAKTLNAVSSEQAKRAVKIAGVADKLLEKIEAYIEAVDPETMNAKSMRSIAGALKDLRDVHNIKTDADIREQEARIRKLQKEAKEENKNERIQVTLNIPEDYIG